MESLELESSARWRLTRDSDGAGDSGVITGLADAEEGWFANEVRVGALVRVGAWRTTMFGADTYWTTTRVTEITFDGIEEIEVDDHVFNEELLRYELHGTKFVKAQVVKFKTGNSSYTLTLIQDEE